MPKRTAIEINGLADLAKLLVIGGRVIASPQAPAYVANWLLRKRFSAQLRLRGSASIQACG